MEHKIKTSLKKFMAATLAIAMLFTSSLSSFAIEPTLNLVPIEENTSNNIVIEENFIPEIESDTEIEEIIPSEEVSTENSEPSEDNKIEDETADDTISKQEDETAAEETIVNSGVSSANNILKETEITVPAETSPDNAEFEAVMASPVIQTFGLRSTPSATTIFMQKVDHIQHIYPFSGGTMYYGYVFYTSEGKTAYCVEPARFNSSNGTIVTGSKSYSDLTKTQQNEIARAIAANPGGHHNVDKYMACQAIIWEIAYNQSPRGGNVYSSVIEANSSRLSSYYEEIRSKMETLGEIPSFMSRDPENPTEHSLIEDNGEWSID